MRDARGRRSLGRRLDVVRALVAGYTLVWLVVRLPHQLGLADLPDRRWYPVGILAPLGSPPPAALVAAVTLLAIPCRRRRRPSAGGRA